MQFFVDLHFIKEIHSKVLVIGFLDIFVLIIDFRYLLGYLVGKRVLQHTL